MSSSVAVVDSQPSAEQQTAAPRRVRKPNPNPKDGWKAFVVAVCASAVQACTFGVSNSFPNFVFEMTQDESLGTPTNSTMSIVQAVALGMAAIFSIPAGIVVHKIGPRAANLISSAGLIAALLLGSLVAKSGEAMIGLYAIPMGIAMGFMMSTGATATSSWFDKHAAIGMGICFTGGGTGSLIVPRIAGALSTSFNWRDSFCILTFLGGLQVLCTMVVCMRPTDGDDDEADDGEADGQMLIENPTDREEADAAAPTKKEGEAQNNRELVAVVSTDPTATEEKPEQDGKPFNYHEKKANSAYELLVGCLLNRNFLGLFACYAFFSIGFYGFLYIAVPFPLSMGTGPYIDAAKQTVDQASNVFVSFGICQTIGGPFLGWIATRTDERLVFIACMGILSVAVSYYSICRKPAEFIAVSAFMGFGISGFFSTFGTMIAQRFWGPNLSVIMSLGFVGAVFGGFLGSTISTEITNADNGNYTNATVMHAIAFFLAGILVMFVVQDIEDSDARLEGDKANGPLERHAKEKADSAEKEQLVGVNGSGLTTNEEPSPARVPVRQNTGPDCHHAPSPAAFAPEAEEGLQLGHQQNKKKSTAALMSEDAGDEVPERSPTENHPGRVA